VGVIPKQFHFIFGLTPDYGGKPFSFVHWAAIRSALAVNPEWKAFVWTAYEPQGRYWEAIKPHVEVRPLNPPDEVYGNPIPHVAHKCDWLRLVVLKNMGGVYLDCDTISVKPVESVISDPVTMVTEYADGHLIGLCNAFIAAEPNADFIVQWMEKFRGFRSTGHDEFWNESPVKWPHEVWKSGAESTALMSDYFMQPDWTPQGIRAMFEECREYPDAIGHHLWESFSWGPYLSKYTPENYLATDCTYSRILDRVLGDEIKAAF
jgi:hypothetical protein